MIDKILELLKVDLIAYIIAGIFGVTAAVFVFATIAAFVLALTESLWWLLAVPPCCIVCGGSMGITAWVANGHWED